MVTVLADFFVLELEFFVLDFAFLDFFELFDFVLLAFELLAWDVNTPLPNPLKVRHMVAIIDISILNLKPEERNSLISVSNNL